MSKPPVSHDLDLRDFQYMPLDVVRLVDSDLTAIASGDEFKAAVLLWCKAWHQIPASSLPNDDRMLAHLAGFGRDLKGWKRVRDVALRGFTLHDDGRLYHPVIAQKAVEAADHKRRRRGQTEAATKARIARRGARNDDDTMQDNEERYVAHDDERDEERNVHQGKGREGKGNSIALTSDSARATGEPPEAGHSQTCIDLLDHRAADLTEWENDFLISIKWAERLTKGQSDKLKGIQDRLATKIGTQVDLPTVRRGTPAYDAWIDHYRGKGKAAFFEKLDAITVPTEFPPSEAAA
jgi:hypothetical protein